VDDKARMQRAVKVAKQKAEDLNKRAALMQSVAKGGTQAKRTTTRKK